MSHNPVLLSFGGNLGEVAETFRTALLKLERGGFRTLKMSAFFHSKAMGCEEGAPDFLNQSVLGIWDGEKDCVPAGSSGTAPFGKIGTGRTGMDEIPMEDLRALPLVIYRRWKKLLDTAFSEAGGIPRYYCIADDARTCISFARAGMGYAIVPLSATDTEEDIAVPQIADTGCRSTGRSGPSFGIRKIINPVICSTICAVTSKTAYRSSALELFLDTIEEELRDPQ